jgi:hypothetical protein
MLVRISGPLVLIFGLCYVILFVLFSFFVLDPLID